MTQVLRQSTAVDVLIGPFLDLTDGATAESGESPSVKLSKNGQALAAKNDATTPVHDADGYYNCEFDATDTNTVGTLILTVAKSATALPVRHEFMVIEEAAYDAIYASSADPKADINVASIDAGAITAAAIATGAIDADALAADAGTEIGTAVWATATRVLTANTNLNDPTAAAIADAVWDEDATGHQTGGTFGQAIGDPGADTNTIYGAVVTGAAGATVAADIIAIKAETASILTDTAEIGAAGAGLTAINLPDQTMNITGNITGNLSGSVGSVTGAVGSVTGLTASDVGAIKTQTDKLTFTVANQVDANVQYVNDVAVTGTGAAGDEWGP